MLMIIKGDSIENVMVAGINDKLLLLAKHGNRTIDVTSLIKNHIKVTGDGKDIRLKEDISGGIKTISIDDNRLNQRISQIEQQLNRLESKVNSIDEILQSLKSRHDLKSTQNKDKFRLVNDSLEILEKNSIVNQTKHKQFVEMIENNTNDISNLKDVVESIRCDIRGILKIK